MQLPSDIAYGFVRWQALLAVAEVVGDTPPAEGDVPKALPASCTVRFTPVVTMLTSTAAGNATIVPQYIEGTIDPTTGLLVDAMGNAGVWLVTGQYKVTFIFVSPAVSLPAITIDVADTHTPAAPRDLALSMTLTPTPATVFVVNQQVYNDTLAASAAASASETAAATSETNAAASASSAATSATAASGSRTAAATSETNAATSATNASGSASAAATSASAAATSATAASGSATAAATSATNASSSASAAATSATNASGSASAASTSASNAATTAAAVPKWWAGTQTAYNALGAYDAATLYLITGA